MAGAAVFRGIERYGASTDSSCQLLEGIEGRADYVDRDRYGPDKQVNPSFGRNG